MFILSSILLKVYIQQLYVRQVVLPLFSFNMLMDERNDKVNVFKQQFKGHVQYMNLNSCSCMDCHMAGQEKFYDRASHHAQHSCNAVFTSLMKCHAFLMNNLYMFIENSRAACK